MRLPSALIAFAALAAPTASLAWTQSYVAEYYEPAIFYGGPANGGGETAGTDCTKGLNEISWSQLLATNYRTKDEVATIIHPDYRAQGQNAFYTHVGFRGDHRENVYENPTAIPDPGLVEVDGKIAEGFDLDHNPATGFTSPTGEKGVDNAFYKVSGCVLRFRGRPREANSFKLQIDAMRDGAFTVVFVLSGEGADPANDPNVTLGIYTAKDHVVKDAGGLIAANYSFRISPDKRFQSVVKARTTNGVLEAQAPVKLAIRDFWGAGGFPEQLILEEAQMRFKMADDGSLTGLIGGYRDFFDHYRGSAGNGRTTTGGIHENLGHYSLVGWYYAMRRAADGLKDSVTGQNRGISTVYRMRLLPAFVVTPDAAKVVKTAQIFE